MSCTEKYHQQETAAKKFTRYWLSQTFDFTRAPLREAPRLERICTDLMSLTDILSAWREASQSHPYSSNKIGAYPEDDKPLSYADRQGVIVYLIKRLAADLERLYELGGPPQ